MASQQSLHPNDQRFLLVKPIAEGISLGKAEGTLATLRLMGIQNVADFRSKMKSEPPPEVIAALSRS